MANRVLVGQFIAQDSPLHRLDPRTKLLGLVALMTVILALHTQIGYSIATLIVFAILLLSRISLLSYARGLLPLLPVLLFTLLYHTVLGKGDNVLASYGFIRVTREGIEAGARIVWRILLMVLPASALTATTPPLRLAQGLETLLKPLSKLRVPVKQFALMIVIAIRFIPTILEEIERIRLARRARGFEPSRRNPFASLMEFIPVLVPLLVTTVQRADHLTLAIEARAYGDGRGRTTYRPLKFAKRDGVAALLILMSLILAIMTDSMWI